MADHADIASGTHNVSEPGTTLGREPEIILGKKLGERLGSIPGTELGTPLGSRLGPELR